MSHFPVLVVGEDPESQLAPFNEAIEVDAYQDACYCIGLVAKVYGRAMAEKKYKPFEQLRKEYHAMNADKRPAWEEHIKPYVQIEEKHEKAHALYNKPDPHCKECDGSGKRETRYNPDSKWDWYSLGGRWFGYWKLKLAAKKSINIKKFLGDPGTGDNKPLFDVDMARKKDIDFESMKEILRKQKEGRSIATFAVLMDGEWYERGNMGWWGMIANEKGKDVWEGEFWKLIEKLPPNTWLSVYDCHI